MTTRSLAARLLTLQVAIIATAIIVIAVSTAWLTNRLLAREEEQGLVETAENAAASINREWKEEPDLGRAARAAMEENPFLGYRIDVLDEARHLVFSTSRRSAPWSSPDTKRRAVHLRRGGWVMAAVSTLPRRRAMTTLLTVLTLVSLSVFTLAFAATRFLARRELAPLARLANQANQLARDMRIHPLQREGDPIEVATVAVAFDHLLSRLDEVLESERNFTRDAAHELRTPLTVISGELEYALADRTLADSHRAHLETAWSQARTLSDLVDALLFLRGVEGASSGRDPGGPVNLGDMVRDLVQCLRNERPSRASDIEMRLPDDALVVGNAGLLAAATRNLIDNALKFTRDHVPVRVTVISEKSRVRLLVEDGGAGIGAEESERVFDPFYRSAEARGSQSGLGLGLSLARRIARAHGGDLRAGASELGGAWFELWLPPLDANSPSSHPAAPPRFE